MTFLDRRVAWVLGGSPAMTVLALPGALGLFGHEAHLAAHHLPLRKDD